MIADFSELNAAAKAALAAALPSHAQAAADFRNRCDAFNRGIDAAVAALAPLAAAVEESSRHAAELGIRATGGAQLTLDRDIREFAAVLDSLRLQPQIAFRVSL